MMQYKLHCMDKDWLPRENGGIQLWNETLDDRLKMPLREPNSICLQRLWNFDEVTKGLFEFVSLWDSMPNKDLFGEFRKKNEHIMYYWRTMKVALDIPLLASPSLHERFWPESTYALSMIDQYKNNDTLREEYAKDAPFIGQQRHHPPPSLYVSINVDIRFVFAVRLVEGDLCSFWIALALTKPHLDLKHFHQIQI